MKISYAASMNADEFKNRTKAFAIRVIQLVEAFPQNQTAKVIGNRLLRCGTSVGANYRAACRAKSFADFIAMMAIVEEECDESIYLDGIDRRSRIDGQKTPDRAEKRGN